jgi:hypothetical protein
MVPVSPLAQGFFHLEAGNSMEYKMNQNDICTSIVQACQAGPRAFYNLQHCHAVLFSRNQNNMLIKVDLRTEFVSQNPPCSGLSPHFVLNTA